MRCPRCGYESSSDRTACPQCGAALGEAAASGAAHPEAATPVWQRPKPPKPAEAPPWSGAENAAPWQTPPEFGVPGRPRRSSTVESTSTVSSASSNASPDGSSVGSVGRAASPAVPDPIATEFGPPQGAGGAGGMGGTVPPSPPGTSRRPLPRPVLFAIAGLLATQALFALVYAGFAVLDRRGIFSALAADPTQVARSAAETSDTVNLVLFVLAGVLTAASGVALGVWFVRLAPEDREVAGFLGLGWMGALGVGLAAVVVALLMHLGSDAGQIATGYVVLGLGALVVAATMAWAALVVFRTAQSRPVSDF